MIEQRPLDAAKANYINILRSVSRLRSLAFMGNFVGKGWKKRYRGGTGRVKGKSIHSTIIVGSDPMRCV
jgi:hypothetical protein